MRNTELRNATRVYNKTAVSFEELKVRREEQEMNISKDQDKPKQVDRQKIDQKLKMLKDLT